MVARSIIQTLCSTRAKQKGVRLDETQSLYQKLHHWRNSACPSYFHWQREENSELGSIDGDKSSCPDKASTITQLQRAVVGYLELHCYMQIESCVMKHGIQERASLRGELLASHLEYETLRAVKDTIALSQWATTTQIQGQQPGSYSLIDLAPQITRDICAGVCMWMCLRGQVLQHRGLPHILSSNITSNSKRGGEDGERVRNQHMANYAEAAITLRDVVASAKSHKDTERVVAGLNRHVNSLKEVIHAHQSCIPHALHGQSSLFV